MENLILINDLGNKKIGEVVVLENIVDPKLNGYQFQTTSGNFKNGDFIKFFGLKKFDELRQW